MFLLTSLVFAASLLLRARRFCQLPCHLETADRKLTVFASAGELCGSVVMGVGTSVSFLADV